MKLLTVQLSLATCYFVFLLYNFLLPQISPIFVLRLLKDYISFRHFLTSSSCCAKLFDVAANFNVWSSSVW